MSAIEDRQFEFLQSAARLILQAPLLGYRVSGGELWRTIEQVQWDVEHGTGDLHSLHPERLAIDLNFFKNSAPAGDPPAWVYIADGSQLADLGAWWKSQGLLYRWGGDFKPPAKPDGNHFSLSPDGVLE